MQAWALQCITGISFDINVGRSVLEGRFDLSLGKLHVFHLNNAQESSSYLKGQIPPFKGHSVDAV
jgi:hypothetical protein